MARWARLGCWCSAAVAYVAAILPQKEAPHLGASDKLDHMIAFLAISILARIGYTGRSGWVLLLLLSAFGGFIELSQMLSVIGRDAEWGDWLADTLAASVGLLAGWLVIVWCRSREHHTTRSA